MFHVKQGWVAVTILMAAPAWAAGEAVRFPGPGLELAGLLRRPQGAGPFPAIVMMHGCSGLWTAAGREPTPLYHFWAEHFRRQGHVRVSAARDRPGDAYSIEAGTADDWAPARHCETLTRRAAAAGAAIEIDVYPDAHHGFDNPAKAVARATAYIESR